MPDLPQTGHDLTGAAGIGVRLTFSLQFAPLTRDKVDASFVAPALAVWVRPAIKKEAERLSFSTMTWARMRYCKPWPRRRRAQATLARRLAEGPGQLCSGHNG